MAKTTWTVAEAKAKFSEVVQKAETEGPQRITRRGEEAVVVVSKKEMPLMSAILTAKTEAAKSAVTKARACDALVG